MTRARVLQEVRPMWFEARYVRQQRPDVTMMEPIEMLGVMERAFHRWSGGMTGGRQEGTESALGRLSARPVPIEEALRMMTLHETRHTGWTAIPVRERW